LPPLAGFLGKAMLLQAVGPTAWGPASLTVVLASALLIVVALSMCGSTLFWKPAALDDRAAAGAGQKAMQAQSAASAALGTNGEGGGEASVATATSHRLALAGLASLLVAASLLAGPLTRFAQATAAQLLAPHLYREAVFAARPAPPAWDVRREMRQRRAEGGQP
jgi:multicomponent K+:H+ antiporter subunit D